jgi:voltage-gated potassium channel Kch
MLHAGRLFLVLKSAGGRWIWTRFRVGRLACPAEKCFAGRLGPAAGEEAVSHSLLDLLITDHFRFFLRRHSATLGLLAMVRAQKLRYVHGC